MYWDWIFALLGGILIGIGASLFLLANGRIAGVSGVLGDLVKRGKASTESLMFVAGFVIAPLLFQLFDDLPEIHITSNIAVLVSAGLLVGVGSQMGSGCTAGHGVCGNARFSKRSIIATLTFMAIGATAVAVVG